MKIVQPLLVLVLLSVPAWLHASNPKVDSLLHLLEMRTAIDRAEVLWEVAYELFDIDNPKAAFYAERAYHEVWAKGDSLQIVKIGTTHTQLQRRLGNLDHSIQMAIPLLQVAKRHHYRKYEKMLLNGLSVSYLDKESFDKALEISYESLTARRQDGDSVEVGIAKANIGYIYYRLSDMKMALYFLTQASNLLQGNPDAYLSNESNLAATYCEMKQFDKALVMYKAILGSDYLIDNMALIPILYQGIATCFLRINQLDSAQFYADRTIQEATKMKSNWQLIYSYIILSRICLERNDIASSYTFLRDAESACTSFNFPLLRLEVAKQKAFLLVMMGEKDSSIAEFKSYIEGSDSLYRGEANRRLLAVQTLNAQKENELKIKGQADILDLQDQLLTRRLTFMIIVSGLLGIVALLAIELFRANKKKEQINRLLDVKVVERTKELSSQGDVLQHFIDEEKILKQRVVREVLSQTNTLRGLIYLGKIDNGSNVDEHLSQADALTFQIQDTVSKLLA